MTVEEPEIPKTKEELRVYLKDLIEKSKEALVMLEEMRDAADLTELSPIHSTILRLKVLIPQLEKIQEKLHSTL